MKRVAVIGGGIAGTAISRLLAGKGLDVTLLEKSGQLCSGATWHAAGLVTRFGGSSKLKKIHVRSLQLLNEMHDKYDIGLHTPGSIRIIEKGNEARLIEAKQNVAMAELFDDPEYPTRLISRDEVKELHPLVNEENVECGVYTPHDGDIDPTLLTTQVYRLAKENGATFKFNTEIVDVVVNEYGSGKSRFILETQEGEKIEADAVVNAAGLWSRKVTDMVADREDVVKNGGMHHPAFVIEHHYAITEPIDAVRELAQSGHNGGRLPVLRDLKGSSYIRQEGMGMLIGPYEDECVVRTDWPRGPPSSWGMELFPDKLDRIEENIMMNIDAMPILGTVGFKTIVNGPTIWTGDSLARVGRSTLPGWYDFNSLTYGIAQSLALAEYLAYIMLEGEQPPGFDASDYFDPLRYGKWATDSFTEAKVAETYAKNNRIVYPFENRSAGREEIKGSYPLHSVLAQHGAQFGSFGASGIETPICYNAEPLPVHDSTTFFDFPWSATATKEAEHVLSDVGLSYSSFSKISVKGERSREFLEHVTTAIVPKKPAKNEGDMPCRLTYATTPKGYVCTEFTLCRESDLGNSWYLVGSRDHHHMDVTWLRDQARNWEGGENVEIDDLSEKICVLHVAGPKSKALLSGIDERISAVPFMHGRDLQNLAGVEGADARVFRVSFTGEQGFEFHFKSELGPQIHDILFNHPLSSEFKLKHFGSAALNSLRMEKGFKLRADLDLSHYKEAGIGPFLAKKRKFLGRNDSFEPARLSKMFKIYTDKENAWSIPGDTPVKTAEGKVIGYTTTAAKSATFNGTYGMGFVYADADLPAKVFVEAYGSKFEAEILDTPPERMKGKDE
mmetsp:Transcript_17250/g.19620  ORF Transcript_17250/g.19620 Transcript_17250/m.19620 type:complete len:842 (+) Transcript_17250:84-2609(+)